MSTQGTSDTRPTRIRVLGNSETSLRQISQFLVSLPGANVVVDAAAFPVSPAAPDSADEDAIMVECETDPDQALTNLRIIAGNRKKSTVIAILKDRSADLVRQVLQAGADDILFWPLELAPTMRLLLQIAAKREPLEPISGGKLCVVSSTIGGVGVTSLVANLALALRYGFEKRVAVVDLDFRSSAVSSYLSLEPSRNISWLGAPGRQINSIELGSALTPHSSGIQLLAAADLTDASESISETTLSGIFDVMRQLFDYVIIDCGGRIDARVVQTWDRSDQLLYVLDQSINGIRCAWRFQQLCDQVKFAAAKPRFVINRFDPTHPASNQQISNALGAEIFARIPADARAMQRREARGRDLWHTSPGSPLVTAYEEIADAIISGKTSANYHTPVAVIPRLLAAIGARQTENGVHVS